MGITAACTADSAHGGADEMEEKKSGGKRSGNHLKIEKLDDVGEAYTANEVDGVSAIAIAIAMTET